MDFWIFFGFFNPVLNDFGRFRSIFGKSADFREIFRFFPEIPDFFDPFRTCWWNLALPRRSVLKKAARGCPRIQIWSHEGPNQSQNHVFERSRCQPVSHGFAHPASRKARVASGLEPRHVLRKQAIFFFFPAKTRTLEKHHAKLIKFGQKITDFWSKIDQI